MSLRKVFSKSRLRRNSLSDDEQPASPTAPPVPKLGPLNDLLHGHESADKWLVEILGDEEELLKQLQDLPDAHALRTDPAEIARGVASFLEALLEEAHKHPRLQLASLPRWWHHYRVELEPLDSGTSPRPEELAAPGEGLEHKTVWLCCVSGTYRGRLVNNGQHRLAHVSITSRDELSRSRTITGLGPLRLKPSNPATLPANLDPDKAAIGTTSAFYCMNTATNTLEGRAQSMWRWFWGASSPAGEPTDFSRRFPGRMVLGPDSAHVVLKGRRDPHHVAPRAAEDVGKGEATLKKSGSWWKR
ncbi:hypothetical protein JCM6882_000862 [Rhodosporidiobolus microsporus]